MRTHTSPFVRHQGLTLNESGNLAARVDAYNTRLNVTVPSVAMVFQRLCSASVNHEWQWRSGNMLLINRRASTTPANGTSETHRNQVPLIGEPQLVEPIPTA